MSTLETNYYKNMIELVSKVDETVAECIKNELSNQRNRLKLIASENYCSPSVQAAMGNLLTDKYAEGFAYHRYYAGTENVDKIEEYACKLACELFGAEHAYVQPHCGADANMIAYWAILNAKVMTPKMENIKEVCPVKKSYNDLSRDEWDFIRDACHKQKLLGLDYSCGGHLTHGFRQNISSQLFDVYSYGVDSHGYIDYDEVRNKALEVKPLVILTGYSAYPRKIDFKRFREIADEVGAVLMVDMAHFAGLVAGGVFTGVNNPVPYADIVTTTTHKTLRGPRGGMILCKDWLSKYVDGGCPLVMGGPLPHVMAAKAIALKEALSDDFKDYASRIVKNSKALANRLVENGFKVQTNGTDNHIVLLDVTKYSLTGRQAENALLECGIVTNRNALPNDKNGAWYTSGLRLGTPALTTRGFTEEDMIEVADIIDDVLSNVTPKVGSKVKYTIDTESVARNKKRVEALLDKHPLYEEIEI